jgi:hypothetical protein
VADRGETGRLTVVEHFCGSKMLIVPRKLIVYQRPA